MTHAVIIRLHYLPNDPRFSWRLAFFKSMVLPRLLNQTNQDFEIWIVCHPEHTDLIKGLSEKIRVCPMPTFPAPEEARLHGFKNHIPHDLPQFDIQTAYDSDDLVSLNYIAKIKEEIAKSPDKTLLVTFQPYKLALFTLKRYGMYERYGDGKCSMFYSLYQPDRANYQSILNFDHSFIGHWCDNIVCVPEGYCDMVIHGTNWMTGIEPNMGEVHA